MGYDPTGHWVDTVFDLFSLGVSVIEVVIDPYNAWNWAGLAGDAFDLIPFVTGVGESIKGIRIVAKGADLADGTLDTIRFAKAVDFTDEAMDTIKALDRTGEFTKSSMSSGRRIHAGYKTFSVTGKEFRDFPGSRIDYFDEVGKAIFELKPYNRNSLRTGVNQLLRYKKEIGDGYRMILEFY